MEYKIIGTIKHPAEVRRFFKNIGYGYTVYNETLKLDLDDVQKYEVRSGYILEVDGKYGIVKRNKNHKYYLSLMFDKKVVESLIDLKYIIPYQEYAIGTTRNGERTYVFGSLEYAQKIARKIWRGYISETEAVMIYDEANNLVSTITYIYLN